MGIEPVAAPGVGEVMLPPDVDGLAMLPDELELPMEELPPMEELLPMGAELPPIGDGIVVSGMGVVTDGAVLAGVLGIVVSTFFPQAAKAMTPDNKAMVRGVR